MVFNALEICCEVYVDNKRKHQNVFCGKRVPFIFTMVKMGFFDRGYKVLGAENSVLV